MRPTLLTEVFGVAEGYELVETEQAGHFLRLHLNVQDQGLVCPRCGSREVSRKGRRHRELQTGPIGLLPVYLRAEAPDCACRDCGTRFEVAPPLPPPSAGSPSAWWTLGKPSRK
jgi:transposase